MGIQKGVIRKEKEAIGGREGIATGLGGEGGTVGS